jgi:hypothetical protein
MRYVTIYRNLNPVSGVHCAVSRVNRIDTTTRDVFTSTPRTYKGSPHDRLVLTWQTIATVLSENGQFAGLYCENWDKVCRFSQTCRE